jgi:hypothetical protein
VERIPHAVYTKELREEAVKLITESGGRNGLAISRLLHMNGSTMSGRQQHEEVFGVHY